MNEDPIVAEIRKYRAEHAEDPVMTWGAFARRYEKPKQNQPVRLCIASRACFQDLAANICLKSERAPQATC